MSSNGLHHNCCTIPSSGHDASAHEAARSQPRPGNGAGEPAVVFVARSIVTLDPLARRTEAVAGQDGLIGSAGSHEVVLDELEHVLLPGFVEPHCHPTQ
jgi:adenine deaminase